MIKHSPQILIREEKATQTCKRVLWKLTLEEKCFAALGNQSSLSGVLVRCSTKWATSHWLRYVLNLCSIQIAGFRQRRAMLSLGTVPLCDTHCWAVTAEFTKLKTELLCLLCKWHYCGACTLTYSTEQSQFTHPHWLSADFCFSELGQ